MQVGNFSLPRPSPVCDFSDMSGSEELEGVRLYDALMALKPTGLAETDWAEQAGVNRGWFGNLKTKSRNPRRDTLRKVLAHIGRTEADLSGEAPQAPRAGGRVSHLRPDQPLVRSADAGEIVEIARLDLSLPMGPGATVDDYVEEEPVSFDASYVRSFTRTPPHRLRLAAGAGDSMFPTLVRNDLVWIDTTQNQLLHSDRIYAASINGGAAIKRLRPTAGGKRIIVISDNKTIEPYEVDASDVVIWGRVIRFARDL